MKIRIASLLVLLVGSYATVACHKKTPPPAASNPATRTPVRESEARPVPAAPAPRRATPAPDERAATTPRSQPTPEEKAKIDELLSRIEDAYFDYDKHSIRPDAEAALRSDAQTLATIIRQYPAFKLVVEGHADERGSDEYNVALGAARAQQAKDYLVSLGLPGDQLNTISYGKQKPVCTEDNETCWQKNRRAHLAVASNGNTGNTRN